jgi:hypothetical protein
MLNLAFIFDDANRALTEHADHLAVFPLPGTIYLMQQDVINHYRYALDHYFCLSLQESFLQNSSIGSPYQKWAFFTNKDFELLSIAIRNLLRYTSRLVHESECVTLRTQGKHSEMRSRSNTYTSLLCEIKYNHKSIGVSVGENQLLLICPARIEPSIENLIIRSSAGGPTRYFRVVCDASGSESEMAIEKDDFDRLRSQIRPELVDITNRSVLLNLRERGEREIDQLSMRNQAFAEACKQYYKTRSVAEPFDNLNESYWML